MSAAELYDFVVIGAGVQGSFAAYQLASRKKKTLLLEQFTLPHTRGSSHGQTRLIRKAYEQNFYTRMMNECYELWAGLEREAGATLYRRTGLLVMGPESSQSYIGFKNSLEKNKTPMVVLTRENFNQHIPNVILAEGDGAFVDTTAGVLYADRALRVVQGQFQKLGGIIKDQEKVTDIKPGPVVTVTASAGVYQAKGVVITAGPWTKTLLAHVGLQLPLQVVRINVCYWKEKTAGTYHVKKRFPCFLLTEGDEAKDHIYGLPSNEYPGLMKVTASSLDPSSASCCVNSAWEKCLPMTSHLSESAAFKPTSSPLCRHGRQQINMMPPAMTRNRTFKGGNILFPIRRRLKRKLRVHPLPFQILLHPIPVPFPPLIRVRVAVSVRKLFQLHTEAFSGASLWTSN